MSDPLSRFQGLAEFVETARLGSFTAAGAALGITGSAVGKSVSRLEARLGTKLLHRTTRSLTLTNDGEAFMETSQSIVDQLDGIEKRLASGYMTPVGKLRVDLPAAFGRRHILPTLTRLSLEHERLDFSVMLTERTSDIIEEGIDLAVRIGELSDNAELVARRLGTQRVLICAAPAYLDRTGVPVSVEELATRDCIIGWRRVARPSYLIRRDDGGVGQQEVHVRHEFSDGEAMLDAVLAGCGLCQLPTWLAGNHLAAGRLVPVLEDRAGGELPINAVWPKSRYMQPKLRIAIDALIQAAQRDKVGFDA